MKCATYAIYWKIIRFISSIKVDLYTNPRLNKGRLSHSNTSLFQNIGSISFVKRIQNENDQLFKYFL